MFYQELKPFLENGTTTTYKKGQIFYHQGDQPQKLFLVESGVAGLFHISENGKETFLRAFGKDFIFGHRSYFAETPYHGTAMALTDTSICIIDKEQCDHICSKNPGLLKSMAKILARSLGESELRLAGLIDKTAPQRIAEALVYLKLKYAEKTWTRKEIAEFSGSTYETVARVMTELDQKALIVKKGRDFTIPNENLVLNYFVN